MMSLARLAATSIVVVGVVVSIATVQAQGGDAASAAAPVGAAAAEQPAPGASAAVAATPPTADIQMAKLAPPDAAKGQATAATCMACHAADGSRGSPAYPILEGQHPEYLVKQLTEFKAGERKNAIMNGMAAILSPADMRNVAAFYHGKLAKSGFAKHADTVAAGEKLYRGGNADRGIPACAGCHGPDGAGIPAQYPRLSGQHADYTTAQLTAFRSGVRANSAVMMGVAAKLSDPEIRAVSDYIAGLR